MKEFANKTQLGFDPLAASVDISTSGVQYTTPADHRETLDDLSRLQYVRGKARFSFKAGTAGGDVRVTLRTAGEVLGEVDGIAPVNGAVTGSFDVDLSGVSGSTPIYWEVNVNVTGTGSADFAGVLNVEHPIIIS